MNHQSVSWSFNARWSISAIPKRLSSSRASSFEADKIRSICQTGVHINNQTRCAALRRSTMLLLLLHILESGKILISLDFPPAWGSWEEKTRKYQTKPRNAIYKEKKVHTPAPVDMKCDAEENSFIFFYFQSYSGARNCCCCSRVSCAVSIRTRSVYRFIQALAGQRK